ncbi:hypothetical protein OAB57_02385 [Bacteriovoracaceae bacterium]|nr:hypothetical protein [Bacteriovoracaceae bacterium]
MQIIKTVSMLSVLILSFYGCNTQGNYQESINTDRAFVLNKKKTVIAGSCTKIRYDEAHAFCFGLSALSCQLSSASCLWIPGYDIHTLNIGDGNNIKSLQITMQRAEDYGAVDIGEPVDIKFKYHKKDNDKRCWITGLSFPDSPSVFGHSTQSCETY